MRRTMIALAIAAAVAFGSMSAVSFAKPGDDKMSKSEKQKSLYSLLGGKKAISAVVDQFIANVVADNRINKFFADTYNKYADRMAPAALIPMHTPQEAVAELEHAKQLGLK